MNGKDQTQGKGDAAPKIEASHTSAGSSAKSSGRASEEDARREEERRSAFPTHGIEGLGEIGLKAYHAASRYVEPHVARAIAAAIDVTV